jgi:hypothetical protein
LCYSIRESWAPCSSQSPGGMCIVCESFRQSTRKFLNCGIWLFCCASESKRPQSSSSLANFPLYASSSWLVALSLSLLLMSATMAKVLMLLLHFLPPSRLTKTKTMRQTKSRSGIPAMHAYVCAAIDKLYTRTLEQDFFGALSRCFLSNCRCFFGHIFYTWWPQGMIPILSFLCSECLVLLSLPESTTWSPLSDPFQSTVVVAPSSSSMWAGWACCLFGAMLSCAVRCRFSRILRIDGAKHHLTSCSFRGDSGSVERNV